LPFFGGILEGLDISKKNMGIHGAKKYRRKSGICVAELAQQVELSGKHWMSAKSYTRIGGGDPPANRCTNIFLWEIHGK
jgi:hypothetical protein